MSKAEGRINRDGDIDRDGDDVLAAARAAAQREGLSFADWIGRRLADYEGRGGKSARLQPDRQGPVDLAENDREGLPARTGERRAGSFAGLVRTLDALEGALRESGGDPVVNQALAKIESRLRALASGGGAQCPRESGAGNRVIVGARPDPRDLTGASSALLNAALPHLGAAIYPEARQAQFKSAAWPPGPGLSEMQNKIADLARQLDDMCRGAETSFSTSREDFAASSGSMSPEPEGPPPPAETESPQGGFPRQSKDLPTKDLPRNSGGRAELPGTSSPDERPGGGLFAPAAVQRIEGRLGALADVVERAIADASGARPVDALSGQLDDMRRQITDRLDESLAASSRQADELAALVRTVLAQDRTKASQAAMDALEREMARVRDHPDGPDVDLGSQDSHELSNSGPAESGLAGRIEETPAADGAADRGAAQDRLPGLAGEFEPRLAREIAGLRIFQDEAGRRAHPGARAVQDNVAGAAERLVKLEAHAGETGAGQAQLASLLAPGLASAQGQAPRTQIGAITIGDETGADFTQGVSRSRKTPRPSRGSDVTGADELLIEPGGGIPLSWLERELRTAIAPSEAPRPDALEARQPAPEAQIDPGVAPSSRSLPAELASGDSLNPAPAPQDVRSSGLQKRPVILPLAAAILILGAFALAGAAKRSGQPLSPAGLEEFAKKLFSARPARLLDDGRAETPKAVQRPHAAAARTPKSDHGLLDPQFVEPWSLAAAERSARGQSTAGMEGDGAPKPVAGAYPMIPGAFANNGAEGEDANRPDSWVQEPAPFSPAPPPRAPRAGPRERSSDAGAIDSGARAQFETGVQIARNSNDPREMTRAAQYYEKAARQGLAIAQYRLAALYEKGLGVSRDLARAKALYLAAAEQGNTRAMHNLGVLAAEGAEGRADYASAAIWFGRAAQAGVRDSQFNIAVLLARGLGAPRDPARAYAWFAILSNEGDAEAAKRRDDLAARLTNAELAAAKAAAGAFRPQPVNEAANEPLAPPAAEAKPKVSGL